MTIIEAINHAASQLSAAGISTARLDAEVLLRHVTGRDRSWLLAHMRDELADEHRKAFERTIERRARREPLQYIVGMQEFWGLEFIVTPDVLIPRPETELIVETALGSAQDRNKPLTIMDLCTGSGCIAVSLAKELPAARIFATDRSEQALGIARDNARRHGVSDRIRFLAGDLFEPISELDIAGRADIIVANPPYVPSGDVQTLPPEVGSFEPGLALVAGPTGMELHGRIIGAAPRFLKTQGLLIMEMGIGQAEKLVHTIHENGAFEEPRVVKDLAGIERVIVARTT
ncbi:MAG TPA: peptide chain release factor N(5)-glutamine methyltransferase [Nitrospirota bacterium]